jgi:tetratricopeptide (TPR) repeat protein
MMADVSAGSNESAPLQPPPQDSIDGGESLRSSESLNAIGKIRTISTSPSTELQRAQVLFGTGNYRGTVEICERIYFTEACRSDNLLLLGAAHFQLRNFPESIFFCQQTVRVDSNCAEAYSNMGNAFKEMGDLDTAMQFYLQAIKLKPRYSDAYNNLACCYLQQSLFEDAIDTFQMAVLLNPVLIDAHCNLGVLYKTQVECITFMQWLIHLNACGLGESSCSEEVLL